MDFCTAEIKWGVNEYLQKFQDQALLGQKNKKFKSEYSLARNMFLRSNMGYYLSDVTPKKVNKSV